MEYIDPVYILRDMWIVQNDPYVKLAEEYPFDKPRISYSYDPRSPIHILYLYVLARALYPDRWSIMWDGDHFFLMSRDRIISPEKVNLRTATNVCEKDLIDMALAKGIEDNNREVERYSDEVSRRLRMNVPITLDPFATGTPLYSLMKKSFKDKKIVEDVMNGENIKMAIHNIPIYSIRPVEISLNLYFFSQYVRIIYREIPPVGCSNRSLFSNPPHSYSNISIS